MKTEQSTVHGSLNKREFPEERAVERRILHGDEEL